MVAGVVYFCLPVVGGYFLMSAITARTADTMAVDGARVRAASVRQACAATAALTPRPPPLPAVPAC